MRPTLLHLGGVLYWTLRTRDPDTMLLKDADATPTVAVRKNGSAVGDSVTVTKRSATTGIYDCSYNPAAEAEGDTFEFEERAQVTGTTTAQAYYDFGFVVRVRAVERGTDNALLPTVSGRTLNVNTDGEGDAVLDTATQQTINDTHDLVAYLSMTGVGVSGSGTDIVFTMSGTFSTGQFEGWILRLMDGCTHRIATTSIEVISTISTVTATLETELLVDLEGNEEITLYPDVQCSGASGGTDWTEEQREYILEQLALLTVSGASVVVTSGVYMCARGDVEQVYGNANIATWADLNNNQDANEITSRINYHIAIADNYIRSVLTQGAWVMPVEGDTIPAILAYNCARLAGVLLYEGRGVTDYDPKGRAIHQLSNHKNGVDSFLKSVVYGSTDLSPLVKSSTNEAPTAS